jgi:threonine/homoserine/homoserine lactone efflux protein
MLVELLKILFGGLCVGLASSVTVGPVAVLCIQRTLSKGHLSGFISSMGVVCADTLMAILAFSVYALMKSYIDEYSSIIQLVGGIFVVIVGVFIFFKNPVPQIRKNKTGQSVLWQDFGSMFGFTLANFVVVIPYILAFFTMFNIDLTIDFHSAGDGAFALNNALHNILVLGGFFIGATLWWLAVTSIISIFHKGFKPRHMIIINRVAGLVIMVLGVATLLSVIIE